MGIYSIIKKIHQCIKDKSELRFAWPYKWQNGTLGENSRYITKKWIESSKLECKADNNGDLWLKYYAEGYVDEEDAIIIDIYFKDGTSESYSTGYDNNIDKPLYIKQFEYGYSAENITKEEYDSKVNEFDNMIDAWK